MANDVRLKIIRLQGSLSTLRKVAGWSAEDLGNLLGVTRQTIVNLESGQTTMTQIQYIAIRAILEAEAHSNSNETLKKLISIMIDEDDVSEEERSKLKETVDTAVSSVGKRSGSAVASKAAIAALIPLLTIPILGFTSGAVAAIAALSSAPWIVDILRGGSKK